jgi:hypothetical protein
VLEKNPALVGLRDVMEARLTVWLDDRLDSRLTQRTQELAALIEILRQDKILKDKLTRLNAMIDSMRNVTTEFEKAHERFESLRHDVYSYRDVGKQLRARGKQKIPGARKRQARKK